MAAAKGLHPGLAGGSGCSGLGAELLVAWAASRVGPHRGCQQGTGTGMSIMLREAMGQARRSHPAGPDLEWVCTLFAGQTRKALLWKRGFCGEIWPLLIFGILFQCSFSRATGIYLVKAAN